MRKGGPYAKNPSRTLDLSLVCIHYDISDRFILKFSTTPVENVIELLSTIQYVLTYVVVFTPLINFSWLQHYSEYYLSPGALCYAYA